MHFHWWTNRAVEIKNVELWIKKEGKDFPSLALRCSLPLLAGHLKQNKPFYFSKKHKSTYVAPQRPTIPSQSISHILAAPSPHRHCETLPEVVAVQCLLFHVWACHASLAVTNIFFIANGSKSNPSVCLTLLQSFQNKILNYVNRISLKITAVIFF